jgi:hypothetical protein
MKLLVALETKPAEGEQSRVFILKPWKRSSSGYLWHAAKSPYGQCSGEYARSLARFLRADVVDANAISERRQIVVLFPGGWFERRKKK